jgi:hypothetical protein
MERRRTRRRGLLADVYQSTLDFNYRSAADPDESQALIGAVFRPTVPLFTAVSAGMSPAQEFSGAVFGSGCVLSTTSSRDDQASIAPEDESG